MLLLLDFLRVPPMALSTSSVAFSLSSVLFDDGPPPIDLRVLRVAGSVASPCAAIFTPWSSVSFGYVAVLEYRVCTGLG